MNLPTTRRALAAAADAALAAGLLDGATVQAMPRPLRRRWLLLLDARQLALQACAVGWARRCWPAAVLAGWEWERAVSQDRIAQYFEGAAPTRAAA